VSEPTFTGQMRHSKAARSGKQSRTYNSWMSMKGRCLNPKKAKYNTYGARGITVCPRWMVFKNFLADMGISPGLGFSIERVNNDGNYEPSNCRWATAREQQNNRKNNHRVTINGKTDTVTQWCRVFGIPPTAVFKRIAEGWDEEAALTIPSTKRGSLLQRHYKLVMALRGLVRELRESSLRFDDDDTAKQVADALEAILGPGEGTGSVNDSAR
jgi:hypothetical protein